MAVEQKDVLGGLSSKAGLNAIREDLDNVRQAWRVASETGAIDLLTQAFPALSRFHELNGSYAEAEAVFEQTMTQVAAVSPLAVKLTAAIADLAHTQSQDRKAIEMATKAIGLAQQVGDVASEALACLVAARVYLTRGANDEALPLLEQGIVQSRASGKTTLEATLHRHVGNVWRQRGDYEREAIYLGQARTLLEMSHDQPQMQTVLNWLGNNAYHRGMYEQAKHFVEQGLALNDVVDDPSRISKGQYSLGRYERIMGNIAVARRLFEASIDVNQRIGDPWQLGVTMLHLAETERSAGNLPAALTQGRRAQRIAQEHTLRELGADCLIILGYVSIDLLDWPAGECYFRDSLAHWRTIGNRVKCVEATAGLAYCLWQQGCRQEAWDEVAAILPHLLEQTLYGCLVPLLPHFLAAQILRAHHPQQAAALDQRIDHILRQEADSFSNPEEGTRFLANHPVARARKRLG